MTGQTGGSRTGPVFLVGPARSGTSLLYKALCLHPDAGYISNWVRGLPRLPQLAVLNRIARRLPAVRRSVWFGRDSNAYVYGVKRSHLERLFPMPVEGEPLFSHCGLVQFDWEREAPPSVQQRALRRSFSSIRRSAGAAVVINKRIANNRRIPQLLAAFPDARFVSIVRDGRAVAYSLSRVDWWEDDIVWWYGGTPRRWREEGGDPWELCARNWVEELAEIEHGLSGVPEAQKLEIAYEGFVAAPIEVLGEVAMFAGLRPTRGGWQQGLSRLSFPDRNEAWARRMEPDVIARVEAIQRPALNRYGYATTTPVEG